MNLQDQNAIYYLERLVARVKMGEIAIQHFEYHHEMFKHASETHYFYSYKGETRVNLSYRVRSMEIFSSSYDDEEEVDE